MIIAFANKLYLLDYRALFDKRSQMEQENVMTAIEAAYKAGEKILSIYNDPSSDFEIERKEDNSPLTIADRAANQIITSILHDKTPFPILSEEGKHLEFAVRKKWNTLWIVDPLDGTKEFIKRNGEFTVNIALVHNSIPQVGVIYVPVKKELYFAQEGLGAYKCNNITAVSSDVTLEDIIHNSQKLPIMDCRETFIVVASRSHLTSETEDFIDSLKQQHNNVSLISSGSSLKICLVAAGEADIYPRFAPTMEWDTAAGHAIARAAGMEIYQVGKDEPLEYNKENLLNPWFIVERRRYAN